MGLIQNIIKKPELQDEWWELETANKLAPQAAYIMAVGQRANGKTYAVLAEILKKWIKSEYKEQGAYIRRYEEDMQGKKGKQLLASHVGLLKQLTKDWDHFKFKSSEPAWYLAKWQVRTQKHRDGTEDEIKEEIVQELPFMWGFSINNMESDKGPNYQSEQTRVTTTIFDEFITRRFYINGDQEPVLYFNILSTIIRDRTDVKNYLIANTVSQFSPYFEFLGIDNVNVQNMKPGQIDLYNYGEEEEGGQLVFEMTPTTKKVSKTNAKYFAFNNPRLQMFKGFWEMGNWQLMPEKYNREQVIYTFYIQWNKKNYTADIIQNKDGKLWTFIYNKSTELKKKPEDLIFGKCEELRLYSFTNILKPEYNIPVLNLIKNQVLSNNVYYQSLFIGEEFNNYVKWCKEN